MKKMICVLPLQNINAVKYLSEGNSLLGYEHETGYPIIPVINAYVKSGEEIKVIVILTQQVKAEENLVTFRNELISLSERIGFRYEIDIVKISYDENLDISLGLFEALLNIADDGDTLYACITYGSKPTTLVEMMALRYAYKMRSNVNIGCIVYGRYDYMNKIGYLHDMTSLFYIDETASRLAQIGAKNPGETIKALIELH